MARKTNPLYEIWDNEVTNPLSLLALAHKHLEWMKIKEYAAVTIRSRRFYLTFFLTWCEQRQIVMPQEVTKAIIYKYQCYLGNLITDPQSNQVISANTRYRHLSSLKCFFVWLTKKKYLLYNPTEDIIFPKMAQKLPRGVLTSEQVEQIINQADCNTPLGIRDRAILETLYSTGIRRQELANLTLQDTDFKQGIVLVKQGKGRKDRLVPIGDRAMKWIEKYIIETRPFYVVHDNNSLFLSAHGNAIESGYLSKLVNKYMRTAGVTDASHKGSCHLLRHSMATLMLENGADIRYIQEILGHTQLTSTEIYTRVSITKLKQVHSSTHPAKVQDDTLQQITIAVEGKLFRDNFPPAKETPNDPLEQLSSVQINDLVIFARKFRQWMHLQNYSPNTIKNICYYLIYFIQWCHQYDIILPTQVTRTVIEDYQHSLLQVKSKKSGQPLSSGSKNNRLHCISLFFQWLTKNNHIPNNPTIDMDRAKVSTRLPRNVFTLEEIEHIMLTPDLTKPFGIRDRAILETLYSTAIRRQEIVLLELNDLDRNRGTLMIRESKTKKDRVVPIGERALLWIEKYLTEVRPYLITQPHETLLFLTQYGHGFKINSLSYIITDYVTEATGKKGSCHLFRHSAATHMLENGADIRYIKEMLGHQNILTTKVYTRVTVKKLKEIHTNTHPAKMHPDKTDQILSELEDSSDN